MKVIVNQNVYYMPQNALNALLKQAEEYAEPGTIYAIQKDGATVMVNERSSGMLYQEHGFTVLRKGGDPISPRRGV